MAGMPAMPGMGRGPTGSSGMGAGGMGAGGMGDGGMGGGAGMGAGGMGSGGMMGGSNGGGMGGMQGGGMSGGGMGWMGGGVGGEPLRKPWLADSLCSRNCYTRTLVPEFDSLRTWAGLTAGSPHIRDLQQCFHTRWMASPDRCKNKKCDVQGLLD